jgi:hypothetical protein
MYEYVLVRDLIFLESVDSSLILLRAGYSYMLIGGFGETI